MSPLRCVVENCKTTSLNKTPGTTFYRCPSTQEMRIKWLQVLKNMCTVLDWSESRICSKHFEQKYFDQHRRLKSTAVPTLFHANETTKSMSSKTEFPKSKIDKLLNKIPQSELTANIKQSLNKLKEPYNLDNFVTEELKCRSNAPMEAHLWLIIKKQQHLNKRLMDLVAQTKRHVEILQANMEDSKSLQKDKDSNNESLKYVVKCLQEKQATLEEQIEILTSVESR